MKGKYLYGIIKRDTSRYPSGYRKPKDTSGVAGRSGSAGHDSPDGGGIRTVDFRSLSAVVTDVERRDYHLLPKEETIKELIGHQQIIEKIMEQSTILPVKFGTILKDEEEVKSVLEKGYFFLRNTLRKIENEIELDLICFWNVQKAAQMACQKSSKVRVFQKKITRKGEATFEDKIALGKLVADYLAERREKLRNQILKTLRKEAVENCSHALADVNMLLNQAFLVEKKKQESFNHTLNILDNKFADLLNFRLVGPLPPYSFATLVIDSLDEKEVEKARETLKLNGQSSLEELKQTYDKLAMKLHPDKGGNPLEFELATVAYKLMRNFIENGLVALSLYKWEER